MNVWQRIVAIAVAAFGLILWFGIWTEVIRGDRDANLIGMLIPPALVLAGSVFALRAIRFSVRLSDDAIELQGLTGKTVLPFDRIEGRRRYVDEGGEDMPRVSHLVLVPNDDRFPKIDIEELCRFDDHFYRWFNNLPDLDEAEKHRPKPFNFGLV
jgi:hypothetical protein